MIDLHTHTTASDGRCSPAELVRRAVAAGVSVLSVTDHDTVAGCEAADLACGLAGVEFVPGIEITSMADGADVHVLGYFVQLHSPALAAFLSAQRLQRLDRLRMMIDRLASVGIELDRDAILQPAIDDPAKAAGRPWIARALVAAGHVADTNQAFERWLARGRPAFVPRIAAPPEDVVRRIHEAGGIASLAHPGLTARDELIPGLAAAGLEALEAFHVEHDAQTTERYLGLAGRLGLLVSGGSDFHGDESHGARLPGGASLPRAHYERLLELRRA